MKKTLAILMVLVFSVGCSTVESIPNINEQQADVAIADGKDSTEVLASPFIYEGITVEGIDVSGTNLESAQELLRQEFGHELSREITINYGDKSYTYILEDLGYDINFEQTAKEALKIGREGSEEERLEIIDNLANNPVDIELVTSLDESKIDNATAEIREDINVSPVTPEYSFDFETEQVVAINGENGLELNEVALKESIKAAVNDGVENIEAPVDEIMVAEDAQANAARINGIIGDAESTFNAGFWPRAENVRVSNRYLDGVVVGPGETWSFNDEIGQTTYEKGYQEAVVINENNEQVPGMGGGVCQTSTALYHALIEAEVQIVNRVPHTQIMPYSPPGLDAAIEYGSAELAFRNDYDFPVLIRAYDDGAGWIRLEIWGDTNVKSHETTLFSEQLPNASDGGLMYASYRRNEDTGEVEYIGDSYYPPVSTWQ